MWHELTSDQQLLRDTTARSLADRVPLGEERLDLGLLDALVDRRGVADGVVEPANRAALASLSLISPSRSLMSIGLARQVTL